jgi:hypothetical protein
VLETSKSILKEYSDLMLGKDFLKFKNIILEENMSKKYKNGHENFSGEKISMVLGLLAWIYIHGKTMKHRD